MGVAHCALTQRHSIFAPWHQVRLHNQVMPSTELYVVPPCRTLETYKSLDAYCKCKGADKVRQWAHNLRRPAHLPGAPPPPPVPLSPPYARATLVPRRAAVLSPRKQARLPCADRRTLSAPTGGSAHFICPKRRMLCAPRPQFMCETGASYVHSYNSAPNDTTRRRCIYGARHARDKASWERNAIRHRPWHTEEICTRFAPVYVVLPLILCIRIHYN